MGRGVDVIPFCCMLMTEMHLVKRSKVGARFTSGRTTNMDFLEIVGEKRYQKLPHKLLG